MARMLRTLAVIVLLVLPVVATFASQRPPSMEQEEAVNAELTAEYIDPERTPEPTPFPTATPVIAAEVYLLQETRRDLELLADDQFGIGQRPAGWNGDPGLFNPQIALLTRGDLELLAAAIINPERRPDGWIGAFSSTPYAVARDVRYDLELLANLVYGRDSRPAGWIAGDPLLRCNRAVQTLVALLERGGIYRVEIAANTPNFCRELELDVTRFVETQILANTQTGELFSDNVALLSEHQITTTLAIAFLDSPANKKVGVIPNGSPIQPVARSYADFSKMMLVRGDGFEVFIDYTNSTVTAQQFRALPNATSLQTAPSCFARWCE